MPNGETLEQFGSCWEGLEDPRKGNATLHDLHELLIIALCCVLCGGQGAVDMAVFAEAKPPPKQLTTCSAGRSRQSGSTKWFDGTGESKTACTGAWMWS